MPALTGQLVGLFGGKAAVPADLNGGFDGDDLVRVRVLHRMATNFVTCAAIAGLLAGGAATEHTRVPTPDAIDGHLVAPPINRGLWIWTDGGRNLSPQMIAAGTLTTDQSHQLRIWNNQDPVVLTSITLSELPGVTVSGPALPALVLSCGELVYDIAIEAAGAANLDGSIVVTAAGMPAIGIPVTGERIVYLMADPDWAAPTSIDVSFDTMIQSSRSGQEQRTALRISPARTFHYNVTLLEAPELADFRKRLALATGRPVATAAWMDGVKLTSPASAADTTINTSSTASRRFVSGGQCVLWQSYSHFVVADVEVVGPASITVSPLPGAMPAGCMVYPLVLCEPLANAQGTLLSDGAGQNTIELIEDLAAIVPTAATPAWQTYRGFPIFELPANWAKTRPTDGSSTDVNRNVVGPGRREVVVRGKQWRVQQSIDTLIFSAAEAIGVEGFFRDRAGRLLPFWFVDLVAVSDVLFDAPGNALTMASVDYATYFGGAVAGSRGHLAIVDQAGNILPRKITSVIDNLDGTETYNLDSNVGLLRQQISRVSFLLFCRFDQDVLAQEYLTDECMRTPVTVIEVPWEAPA